MRSVVVRLFLFSLVLVFICPFAVGGCVSMEVDQNDDAHPDVAAKKANYALSVISDQTFLAKDPACVRTAIMYLGMNHVAKAIPELIRLLNYHQNPGFGHLPRGKGEEYPAIDGLAAMGEQASPALLKVLAMSDSVTVESANALDTFMNIYRENVDKGLHLLKIASQKQDDSTKAFRLTQALNNARALWCRRSSCTE